jgi:starch phosphorylase
MKFAMNGALTIGTLDGANIEIRNAVGHENFFLFGLTADQVESRISQGYRPWSIYESNPFLREIIDALTAGQFSRHDGSLFRPLLDQLLERDPYFLFADYQSYVDCQDRVSQSWRDPEAWSRMAILNAARIGKFSSDRAIREYAQNIWRVPGLLHICS